MASGRLCGETAIVAGGASGIGCCAATLFHSEGARVVIADCNAAAGERLAAALGEGAMFVAADLSRAADVAAAFEASSASLGPASILLNCVGSSGRRRGDGPVDECIEEAWDFVLANNLKSAFLLSKHAIPAMRGRGGGAIVHVASVLGMVGHADFATHAYAASKGGLISLTRAMAVCYAPERIRVNAICPGLIDTPMTERAAGDPDIRRALGRLQPLTGTLGKPEDVARAALFLAGPESGFITGAVLPVDAGWTAQ